MKTNLVEWVFRFKFNKIENKFVSENIERIEDWFKKFLG